MFSAKFGSVLMAITALVSTAAAQGIGGTALPVEPGRFRSELDGGFIYPQLARFKFGDVRNVFPVSGGEVIQNVFDERPYAVSYYAGAREGFRLPGKLAGGPLELNLRFGIYNASHRSSFSENETTPEIYVPYIDGLIRPSLAGGAVVGLFADSDLSLHRKFFSYEIEGGLRAKYTPNQWSLMPGIFFTYQKIEQRDLLDTAQSTDPTNMTLSAHINSNQYVAGLNFRFSSPLKTACWLGCLSVGGECSSAHYHGRQTFTGAVFDQPDEQLAVQNDHRSRWGISTALETGVGLFCNRKVSLSILGNARYMNVLPYVKYPVPIINTQEVTGPAKLSFQGQWSFGGEMNLSAIF